MRNIGRQAADASQALRPSHGSLHAAELGQILKMDHAAHGLAGVIGQWRGGDRQASERSIGVHGFHLLPNHPAEREILGHDRRHSRNQFLNPLSQRRGRADAEDLAGCVVHRGHRSVQGCGHES